MSSGLVILAISRRRTVYGSFGCPPVRLLLRPVPGPSTYLLTYGCIQVASAWLLLGLALIDYKLMHLLLSMQLLPRVSCYLYCEYQELRFLQCFDPMHDVYLTK